MHAQSAETTRETAGDAWLVLVLPFAVAPAPYVSFAWRPRYRSASPVSLSFNTVTGTDTVVLVSA
jgi:hypothetical protein